MNKSKQKKIVRTVPHSLNITGSGMYEFIPVNPQSWTDGVKIIEVFRDNKVKIFDFVNEDGDFLYRSVQFMGKDYGNPFVCDMVVHVMQDGALDVHHNTDI